jgi:protein TonB
MLKAVIRTGIVVLALALPVAAHAQQQVASSAMSTEQTYLAFQVDRTVSIKTPVRPQYPEALRAGGVEGEVLVQFIVDENGNAQMSTFKVLKSTDNAFTEAVKLAVSSTRYTPAELSGHKVKQLVQQPFKFAPSK